ncbi:hypothetical protein K456DRAFT_35313 [Colletotrichum gloeosporioides 23]|nr:hypothetical protein K456DRAFT_35313 [Colletotrichum gloeosporioides 23]
MGPMSAKLHPGPVFKWAPFIRLILLALSSLILGVHVLVCLARRTAPVQQNDWEWTREKPTASSTPASTRSIPIRTEPANFGIIFQQDVEHFPHGQERPCCLWPCQTLTNTTKWLIPYHNSSEGQEISRSWGLGMASSFATKWRVGDVSCLLASKNTCRHLVPPPLCVFTGTAAIPLQAAGSASSPNGVAMSHTFSHRRSLPRSAPRQTTIGRLGINASITAFRAGQRTQIAGR